MAIHQTVPRQTNQTSTAIASTVIACVVFAMAGMLFLVAHVGELFTDPIGFFVRCIIWGIFFGLPIALCFLLKWHIGKIVVAALFILAAGLDIAVVAYKSFVVQPRAAKLQAKLKNEQQAEFDRLQADQANRNAEFWFEAERRRIESQRMADAERKRQEAEKAEQRQKALLQQLQNQADYKRKLDERELRNKARISESAKAIEALDKVVPKYARGDWQRHTNTYRLGKVPSEYERDQFFKLVVELQMASDSFLGAVEKLAASKKMTVEQYRASQGFPLPTHQDSAHWNALRDNLKSLEYR